MNKIFFSCASERCTCAIGNENLKEYGTKPELHLKEKEKEIDFFYEYIYKQGIGLVQKESGNKDILEAILAIDDNNTNKIIDFLNKYGFPVMPMFAYPHPVSCDLYIVTEMLLIVKNLALLVNEIKKKKFLYTNKVNKSNLDFIFEYTSFLIFHAPVEYSLSNGLHEYRSPVSDFFNSLYGGFRDENDKILYKYSYYDRNPSTSVPIAVTLLKEEYLTDSWGDDDYLSTAFSFYKKINQYLTITDVRENGTLVFGEKFSNIFENNAEMIEALIFLANKTMKDVFENALSDTQPTFSYETFSLDWVVPDLLSGMYLALLFKPQKEIFKKCENPRCKRVGFFSSNIASNKKSFCCKRCQNNAAQADYTKRKKEMDKNTKKE